MRILEMEYRLHHRLSKFDRSVFVFGHYCAAYHTQKNASVKEKNK